MKATYELGRVAMLLAVILLLLAQASPAGETGGLKQAFVDLDGDGFDDNLSDSDGDGIPDVADKVEVVTESFAESIGDIFNVEAALEVEEISTCDMFGKLSFTVRGVTSCRGGFDAGEPLEPTEGLVSLSGVCIGGVCF